MMMLEHLKCPKMSLFGLNGNLPTTQSIIICAVDVDFNYYIFYLLQCNVGGHFKAKQKYPANTNLIHVEVYLFKSSNVS